MIGLTNAIEQVYSLCDKRLICPFAFLQSLCIYSVTGSRKTVDLNGKVKPSGLVRLYSLVCVGPGRIPRRPVFSQRGSNNSLVEFFR